ncbi:MAG: M55 family metallopeptidase [Oscillospiraceae bacterium]|nr:M55 family metallopeptidase [Oscillospiraceae bacterium]
MKVYLMSDLEGAAGVLDSVNWCYPDSRYYELAKELLTREVNAAVDGFFAAGADQVVVQDGHGAGGILVPLLDDRARLQRGWEGPGGGAFPFGLDESYDVMAWVGQHPKAGTPLGHLCHTGSFDVLDFSLNGVSVGEFGQLAFLGAVFGAVPIFASGCLSFTREAEALVPGIETVAVKEGVRSGSGDACGAAEYERRNAGAIHLSPGAARERIRLGAARALTRYRTDPDQFRPARLAPPYSKRIRYRDGRVLESGGADDLALLLNS